ASLPMHRPWSGGVTSPTPTPPFTLAWSASLNPLKVCASPVGPPSVLTPAPAASAAPTLDIALCARGVSARGPLGLKLEIRGVRPETFPACTSRMAEPALAWYVAVVGAA